MQMRKSKMKPIVIITSNHQGPIFYRGMSSKYGILKGPGVLGVTVIPLACKRELALQFWEYEEKENNLT